jgi:serine O-acetyltransferase
MSLLARIREDIQTARRRDPAAINNIEILLAYPGLHAIWVHHIAHWFHLRRVPVIPRLLSHLGRFLTGIEIHPGATIGRRCFIDHGMGTVVGETARIGDDVLLYQGVTLGGTGKERGKRHPTLGNNVVVGVGAQILGAITIGDGTKVGAGAVVLKGVPPHCTVVGVPGRVVAYHNPDNGQVERLPDPEAEMLRCLQQKIFELEDRIIALETQGREGHEQDKNARVPFRRKI